MGSEDRWARQQASGCSRRQGGAAAAPPRLRTRCPPRTPHTHTLTRLSRKEAAFCTLASASEHRRNSASNTSGKTCRKCSRVLLACSTRQKAGRKGSGVERPQRRQMRRWQHPLSTPLAAEVQRSARTEEAEAAFQQPRGQEGLVNVLGPPTCRLKVARQSQRRALAPRQDHAASGCLPGLTTFHSDSMA